MKRLPGLSLPVLYAALAVLLVFTLVIFFSDSSPSGFSVFTGQAISDASEGTAETRALVQCLDSDGRGAVQTAGSVTRTFSDGSKEGYTDVCEGSATVDYACSGTDLLKESFTPADCICQNGACIQCVATECNPSNVQQICANGRWTSCPVEQVCVLERCETPKVIPRVLGGSSESGGGGGEASTSTSPSPPPETVISLGALSLPTTQDLGKNEKMVFTISSTEYTLKIKEMGSTNFQGIWTSAGDTTEHVLQLSVGEETTINTFTLKLKSINAITSRSKFLIVPPAS